MGKKKFKKFKNEPKNQKEIIKTVIKEDEAGNCVEIKEKVTVAVSQADIDAEHIAELDEKYRPIHRDVNKLMVVLASLAIIFVGVYFLNDKTTIIANIGTWIYKIGNFQL